MSAHKVCVAGFGQRISLWLSIKQGQLTECTIEEPKRHEHIEVDDWFAHHFMLVPINPTHGPKTTTVCPYLTLQAGKKAANAVRDYSINSLAMAFISQYGWQIANGACPLPDKSELAKVYAGEFAVYLYVNRNTRERAALRLRAPVRG